jgi:hypothetical protein
MLKMLHCLHSWLTGGSEVVSLRYLSRSNPHKHLFVFLAIISVIG